MNWMGQYWFTYLFVALALSCSINAAVYSDKLKTAKTIWFIFMTCIWIACIYYNWKFI